MRVWHQKATTDASAPSSVPTLCGKKHMTMKSKRLLLPPDYGCSVKS